MSFLRNSTRVSVAMLVSLRLDGGMPVTTSGALISLPATGAAKDGNAVYEGSNTSPQVVVQPTPGGLGGAVTGGHARMIGKIVGNILKRFGSG